MARSNGQKRILGTDRWHAYFTRKWDREQGERQREVYVAECWKAWERDAAIRRKREEEELAVMRITAQLMGEMTEYMRSCSGCGRRWVSPAEAFTVCPSCGMTGRIIG